MTRVVYLDPVKACGVTVPSLARFNAMLRHGKGNQSVVKVAILFRVFLSLLVELFQHFFLLGELGERFDTSHFGIWVEVA